MRGLRSGRKAEGEGRAGDSGRVLPTVIPAGRAAARAAGGGGEKDGADLGHVDGDSGGDCSGSGVASNDEIPQHQAHRQGRYCLFLVNFFGLSQVPCISFRAGEGTGG